MKKVLKKQWPLIAMGILLVIVGLYLTKGLNSPVQGPVVKDILSGEGLHLKDIHYVQDSPEEGLKWILDAKEVNYSEDKNSLVFREFKLKLEPKGRPAFQLVGENGNYARDTGVINLQGHLRLTSENGYKMEADHLLINEKRGHLTTDKQVKISGPFFSVAGKGLFVDVSEQKIKILSHVTTVVQKELSAL